MSTDGISRLLEHVGLRALQAGHDDILVPTPDSAAVRRALVVSMGRAVGLSAQTICKKIGITTTNLHRPVSGARLNLRCCMSEN